MPARKSSVFLAGLPSLAARIFNPSSTAYSALGNVKLSRTILGFLSLTGFTGVALAAGFVTVFAVDFAAGFATGFTFGFAGAAGFLAVAATFATTLAAGLTGALVATGLAVTGLSAAAITSTTGMVFFQKINGIYSLYGYQKVVNSRAT